MWIQVGSLDFVQCGSHSSFTGTSGETGTGTGTGNWWIGVSTVLLLRAILWLHMCDTTLIYGLQIQIITQTDRCAVQVYEMSDALAMRGTRIYALYRFATQAPRAVDVEVLARQLPIIIVQLCDSVVNERLKKFTLFQDYWCGSYCIAKSLDWTGRDLFTVNYTKIKPKSLNFHRKNIAKCLL